MERRGARVMTGGKKEEKGEDGEGEDRSRGEGSWWERPGVRERGKRSAGR